MNPFQTAIKIIAKEEGIPETESLQAVVDGLYGITGQMIDCDIGSVRHAVIIAIAYQTGAASMKKKKSVFSRLSAGDYQGAEIFIREWLSNPFYCLRVRTPVRYSRMIKTGELLDYYQ